MSCRNVISLGFDNIRAKPLFFYLTVQIRNDGRTFTILKRVTTVLISLATWTQHEVQFLRIRNQRELIRPWNYMSLWWYRSSRCCWLRFTTLFPFLNSFRLSHIKKGLWKDGWNLIWIEKITAFKTVHRFAEIYVVSAFFKILEFDLRAAKVM